MATTLIRLATVVLLMVVIATFVAEGKLTKEERKALRKERNQLRREANNIELQMAFKSKRYRDKLRTEVKALESLLPVDRTALSRKLDSQTVFRLVIALLRIKGYFQTVGQTPEQTVPHHTLRLGYDINSLDVAEDDDVTQFVQSQACLQVLDGFLLVLTADGNILYVSENVLQYLGYNQVDLMHRCLYSIVHHDDMMDLRTVLETSLGHLVTHFDHQANQEGNHHVEECSLNGSETCKPLSFICRMRCFSGSSVGYLKMHCSGKIVQQASLPKSKRLSSNVVLLFCNPFMLRAAEFNTDLQKNVFWTKHDLDLNIKEVDKKGAEIIGFQSEEIEKRSFYTLIHPEDLTALATCHKMLVESSDVQTVHFRLQTKGQDWVWMTSRGKVISKNSKKFSIAFSHCPLREEDSTYIQQEAILRRRYAISDLMCLAQFKQSVQPSLSRTSDKDDSKHQNGKSKKQQDHQRFHPYGRSGSPSTAKSGKSENKKEEAALLDTSCILEVSCPSTWHCMSDRHSPVLPSSHVAHKISQREKQLQFQEFCRRQQMEDGTSNHSNQTASSAWNGTHPCSASPSNSVISGQDMRHHGSSGPSVNGITPSPNPAYLYSNESHVEGLGPGMDYGFYQSQASHSAMGNYVHHWYAPGEVMLNQSAVACLTPSRSPHQCGVMPSLQASASTPCSYQPVAHSGASHRQPSTSSCSYPSFPPCSMQSVGVGIAYAMSMPPSPPPSPLPNQRPVAAYQLGGFEAPAENGGSETAVHAASKPEWFSSPSSSQQLYFPGYPSQQPPPYPGTGGTASATAQSTIHDLKKTTEKFLPVKTEKEYEEDRNLPGNQAESQAPAALESMGSYRSSDILGGRSSWALNHPFNTAAQMSHSVQLNTSCEQVNRNGILVMQTPMEVPVGYFPHAMQEAQMMQPALFHSGSPATAQYMTYPYPSPYPNLGSPPAYPYSVYQQLGGQPAGQYPVHRFYTPQGVPLKTAADFSGPLAERSLDLPSIGSFLEYLNEV